MIVVRDRTRTHVAACFGRPALSDRNVHRELVSVVVGENAEGQTDLFEIVRAGDLLCLGLRFRQSRQEQTRKDGDNGDYDQQLNERESPDFVFAKNSLHSISVFCWVNGSDTLTKPVGVSTQFLSKS